MHSSYGSYTLRNSDGPPSSSLTRRNMSSPSALSWRMRYASTEQTLCGTLHAYCMILYEVPKVRCRRVSAIFSPGSRVQIGMDIGPRLGQPGSQTLNKFVKHSWWHPHDVMKCTRAFNPQLHYQLVIQSKLYSSYDPSSNPHSS